MIVQKLFVEVLVLLIVAGCLDLTIFRQRLLLTVGLVDSDLSCRGWNGHRVSHLVVIIFVKLNGFYCSHEVISRQVVAI